MAVSTIDPSTALIVVDLQNSLMAAPTVHPMQVVVKQSRLLADAFRKRRLPVVLVNAGGAAPGRNEMPPRPVDRPADWNEIVAEMNRQSEDILVTKRTWGAFNHTSLDLSLKELGVTQVVICGVATSIGVESTARSAHELGYNVTLAIDAMSDPNADCYVNSVMRIFPKLGETGTSQEIIRLLEGADG